MTILPKKKTGQSKSTEEAAPDPNQQIQHGHSHTHSHHGVHSSLPSQQLGENLSRDRLYVSGQSAPSCWPAGVSRDEKRPVHSSPSHYEEYDSLDGPTHTKRRLRASPHRLRSKHRERSQQAGQSPSYPSTSSMNVAGETGSSSPIAGPSGASGSQDVASGSGYNSGDEHNERSDVQLTEEEWAEKERRFEKRLRKKGFVIKSMREDGACLFRAVADQVYGDQEMHSVVRRHCMDYMAKNADYFAQYVTEDFDAYVNRKRQEFSHGNHVEIQALSEMYNRTVEVYCYSTDPINTFSSGMQRTDYEPVRLSYHKGTHYNSIVDPYKATIGVGLGLPGLVPGLAEKNLMSDACSQSEAFHLEQARSSTVTSSSTAGQSRSPRHSSSHPSSGNSSPSPDRDVAPDAVPDSSPKELASEEEAQQSNTTEEAGNAAKTASVRSSPSREEAREEPTFQVYETASFLNQLPPDVFGLSDWEDADILAQVLAASQQEYLDTLKKSCSPASPTPGNSSSAS
ncbi:unnamed protein product [Darwinula stevensoni]|uniref:ubiquitinyl hydrolase 1 n=1 Tax=Darwinula stevensoni TaxID=69355 RepID=A0A7R8XHT7_9CRUS|nr:unnamed protein product [Darwinula stevensoni]CAG0893177.1 unnamed protein product [Darwinula stevensoni]